MKSYEFKVTIYEGKDEFWESIDCSGCNEVETLLKSMFAEYGFYDDNCEIKLISFKENK